jgi:hypothetical protein
VALCCAHIEFLDEQIEQITQMIQAHPPFSAAVELLCTIPASSTAAPNAPSARSAHT